MQYGTLVQNLRSGCWHTEEVESLRSLAASGVRAAAIASVLHRTEASIRSKAFGCGIELISERSPRPVTLRRLVSASEDVRTPPPLRSTEGQDRLFATPQER